MEEGRQVDTGRGTTQGAVISPLLANIYLHYVLDLWVAKRWRPQEACGEMYIVRYADDYVAGFELRSDAQRFLRALKQRFSRFGLELHPEKTRLIEFGRNAERNRRARGSGGRRRSISLGSRTTVGEPGRDASGWDASRRRSG